MSPHVVCRYSLGAWLEGGRVGPERIDAVVIGTTHFTNAFIQRRDLVPVFAIRAGVPAGRGISPFSSWPDDLKSILCGGSKMVGGGYEYDGREIAPLDEAAIVDAIDEIGRAHV